jgi:hypothetical protein
MSRHGDRTSGDGADGATDHHAGGDISEVDDALIEQRRDDRHQHTNGGDHVAATGGRWRAQHLQTKNKEACSEDVTQLCYQFSRHDQSSFFLKKPSMRSVTM